VKHFEADVPETSNSWKRTFSCCSRC